MPSSISALHCIFVIPYPESVSFYCWFFFKFLKQNKIPGVVLQCMSNWLQVISVGHLQPIVLGRTPSYNLLGTLSLWNKHYLLVRFFDVEILHSVEWLFLALYRVLQRCTYFTYIFLGTIGKKLPNFFVSKITL